jgi:hypothetical protein
MFDIKQVAKWQIGSEGLEITKEELSNLADDELEEEIQSLATDLCLTDTQLLDLREWLTRHRLKFGEALILKQEVLEALGGF